MEERRKQCSGCPWKKSVDILDIPEGYDWGHSIDSSHGAHQCISDGSFRPQDGVEIKMIACHETLDGRAEKVLPCVGWLVNQLGPGNNIALRIAVCRKQVNARVDTVGEQHECFEDILPTPGRRRRRRRR